jgi:hypothetical protein
MSKRGKGASMREYKARSHARQKNTAVHSIEIPTTAGLACNKNAPIVISKDAVMKDTQDHVIICVWEKKVGKVNIDKLLKFKNSNLRQSSKRSPEMLEKTKQHYILGLGRVVKQKTSDTNEEAEKWISRNQPLWRACGRLFREMNFIIYRRYSEIQAPLKLVVWTTCSITFNWHPHKDQGD